MTKYYAVKKGHKTGILKTYQDFDKSLKGYKNSEGRVFGNLKDAKAWLKKTPKKARQKPKENIKLKKQKEVQHDLLNFKLDDTEALAFTDGSFNEITKEYTYGCVFFSNKNGYEEFYKKYKKDSYSKYANMAGEYAGIIFAITYAIENNFDTLNLYFDASDIEYYANIKTKTKSDLNTKYNQFINTAREKLEINFNKITAHSRNYYHDRADRLADMAMKLQIEEIHPIDKCYLNNENIEIIKKYLPETLNNNLIKLQEKLVKIAKNDFNTEEIQNTLNEIKKIENTIKSLNIKIENKNTNVLDLSDIEISDDEFEILRNYDSINKKEIL